jgi:hypothetical protein
MLATHASFAKSAAHHAKSFSQPPGHDSSRSASSQQSTPAADHDNAGTSNNAGMNERGGKQSNKIEGNARPNGGGVKVPSNEGTTGHNSGSVESRTRDENAIDTRTIAPSRNLNNSRTKAREHKDEKKSVAAHSFVPRHRTVAGAMHGPARNAIGMPIVRPAEIKADLGKAYGLQSGAPATGVERNTSGSLAKFDASVGRQNAVQSNTNPTLNSATLSHGAINGTAFARPGFVPAAIGGPRKVFAGISGNMIRPKY